MNARPIALLAEVTYRCPLHCPYCSNPTHSPAGTELTTEEWIDVLRQASEMGVLHVGFSGGEPLLRNDLTSLISSARSFALYTNLLTSGIGLTHRRAGELKDAGLDSFQLSIQADEEVLADKIAGTRAHANKLAAARIAQEVGFPLSINVVLHRANIDRLGHIITLAEALGASRLELANAQYYGWAFLNREALLPTPEQVQAALATAKAAKARLAGRMEVFYVLPDYFEQRPKPCMQGWGQRYLTVNALGEALPCPTASAIPNLRFENVRQHTLDWIWNQSESFTRFRGTEWMPEPCRSCPQQEIDFGGCRCQAALITGDAGATDPVCEKSPLRHRVDAIVASRREDGWTRRENPSARYLSV